MAANLTGDRVPLPVRVKYVKRLSIFSGLDKRSLEAIAEGLRVQTFAKGTFIFRQGDEAGGIWFLIEGRVQIVKTSADATQRILHMCLPCDLFGVIGYLDGGQYPATAEATVPSLVGSVSRQDCQRLDQFVPDFRPRLSQVLCTRLRDAHRRLLQTGTATAEERLADFVLQIAQPPYYVILDPPTHQEMALYIGSARETVSRCLSRWQEQGWIEACNGCLIINKPQALAMGRFGRH